MIDEIDGQKVKRVLLVIELENGKSVIARPTEFGNVKGLLTLNDLQRSLSNNDAPNDTKFRSPIVFALDLRDSVKEWIKELDSFAENPEKFDKEYFYLFRDESDEHKDIVLDEGYESSDIRGAITWIKYFFNLEE